MNEQKHRKSREANKAAWIGLLGAILGAVVAIIGPIHYQRWIKGPEEARFALDITSIRATDVDPRIRDQVTSYPVYVKLWHRDGPTALGISVHLTSKHELTDLKVISNTEKATIALSPDKNSVDIEASDLRKGGIVQFEFSSKGDPSIAPTVQVKSGNLIEDAAARIYAMLRDRTEYADKGMEYYEEQYQERSIANLKRNAKRLGYELSPVQEPIFSPIEAERPPLQAMLPAVA